MESKATLADVRQSLDKVTLDFFDTLESLYQSQAQLDAIMRGGFLSLSRARYSMGGPRNVGALQFANTEMEALSVVDVSADDTSDGGSEWSWVNVDMSLVHKQAGQTKTVESKGSDKSEDLRHRRGPKVSAKEEVETVGMQKEGAKSEDSFKSKEGPCLKDPLTLFGLLVSPHLRQSQSSFKQAVAVVVVIANLKIKLQGLQQQFQHLMTQKQSIMAS